MLQRVLLTKIYLQFALDCLWPQRIFMLKYLKHCKNKKVTEERKGGR